jgi:hypothetical protein
MKSVCPEGRTSLRVHDKEEDMYTLEEWKAMLGKELLELKQLEEQDANTRMRRSMKEQQWHAYKSKVRPEQA